MLSFILMWLVASALLKTKYKQGRPLFLLALVKLLIGAYENVDVDTTNCEIYG